MEKDGKPFYPFSGEFHYSRMDDGRWEDELIKMLFLGNTMISDNFCNGDTWEIGLRERKEALKKVQPVLTVAPIREGATVNVESAMAARNEVADREIARLDRVALQPVYEIRL